MMKSLGLSFTFAFLASTALAGEAALATSNQSQTSERFAVSDWKRSFSAALKQNNSKKIQELSDFSLLEKKAIWKCLDCEAQSKMLEARQAFDKAQYTRALSLYNEIPKSANDWLPAVEERGWSYFRQDDFEKALAQTKTLLSPQFIEIVDTEAFFLQSLSQLRICDYEGILETHRLFKEKQRTRLVDIQKLSKSGVNESLQKMIPTINQFPLKFEDFGEKLTTLPFQFFRDVEFQKQLLRIKIAQAALSALAETPRADLTAKFEQIKQESSEKLKNRLQVLASNEVKKNAKIVQKLNLIEVEAIQRIHTDMKMSQDLYKKGDFKQVSEDQLIFMDDGQPWIDELDKYDVAAKACPQNIRRKM